MNLWLKVIGAEVSAAEETIKKQTAFKSVCSSEALPENEFLSIRFVIWGTEHV